MKNGSLLNSLVEIYKISPDGTIRKTVTSNIITNDGDIYYAKKITGEPTDDFSTFVLDLGGSSDDTLDRPEPSKDMTELPLKFASVPLNTSYGEPITSFAYKFYIKDITPELTANPVEYIGISNNDPDNPKLLNVIKLDTPITLEVGDSYLFAIKHTVYFPGTEDNKYRVVDTAYGGYTYLDLPDSKDTTEVTYKVVDLGNDTSPLSQREYESTFRNFELPNQETSFSYVIYKGTKGFDRLVNRDASFLSEAEFYNYTKFDAPLKYGYIFDEIDFTKLEYTPPTDVTTSVIVFSTIFIPKETGYWWFTGTSPYSFMVYVNGERIAHLYKGVLAPNSTGEFVPYNIYPSEGYMHLTAGVEYQVNIVFQVIHNDAGLIAEPRYIRDYFNIAVKSPSERDMDYRPINRYNARAKYDYYCKEITKDAAYNLSNKLTLKYLPGYPYLNTTQYQVIKNDVTGEIFIKIFDNLNGDSKLTAYIKELLGSKNYAFVRITNDYFIYKRNVEDNFYSIDGVAEFLVCGDLLMSDIFCVEEGCKRALCYAGAAFEVSNIYSMEDPTGKNTICSSGEIKKLHSILNMSTPCSDIKVLPKVTIKILDYGLSCNNCVEVNNSLTIKNENLISCNTCVLDN